MARVITRSPAPSRENDLHDWKRDDHERDSRAPLADAFFSSYQETFNDYIAETWLPETVPWTTNQWSHDNFLDPKQLDIPRQDQSLFLFTEFDTHQFMIPGSHSPTVSAGYETLTASSDGHAYQSSISNQIPQNRGTDFSPPANYHQQDASFCGMSSFQVQMNGYSDPHGYGGGDFTKEAQISQWSPPADTLPRKPSINTVAKSQWSPITETSSRKPSIQISTKSQWSPTTESFPRKHSINVRTKYSESPTQTSSGLTLDWSTCDQSSILSGKGSNTSPTVPNPKRKASSEGLGATETNSWIDTGKKDIEECVDVFENAPGALASVKRRRKLDAPVRKAAREVRKAGACHQCRFRKRTCSTGTPCASCLKNGNGLHDLKCQRESPFIGKMMHQYFAHSSSRRIVSFDIKVSLKGFEQETITIDGIGKLVYPLRLLARKGLLRTFSVDLQDNIKKTEDPRALASDEVNPEIFILEDDESLGTQVEQWAVEYTSKFVHNAGPSFYSTTIAHILGEAYVKKRLPESSLVATMLRVSSIAFILRAGVKATLPGSRSSPRFRTIQARIDTILYQRLKLAEKDIMTQLQRLIFRSAGCLTREQVYPVGLVLWQLLRFLCISSSHLSNIAQRFPPKPLIPADYQTHGLKLVVSTHLALFRSSNPLLLNVSDKFNQDLLGSDPYLIKLGGIMRDVVLKMKDKGFPEMKGSITFRKEYFDLFRKVYDMK